MTRSNIFSGAIGMLEFWSVLTTVAALSGMAFLYGCFHQFGANFLFLFGLEDILVATVYAMGAIAIFCLILWAMVLLFRDIFSAVFKSRREISEYSWLAGGPAFLLMGAAAFWAAASLAEHSKGEVNFLTTSVVPLAVTAGLLLGFAALRGHANIGLSRHMPAVRGLLSVLSLGLLLIIAPNGMGFAYIIYLWDGPDQLEIGRNVGWGGEREYFGGLPCTRAQQVLWIGSKVTILRCDNNLIGKMNATGERFWLSRRI